MELDEARKRVPMDGGDDSSRMLYSPPAFSDVYKLRVTITNVTVRRVETEEENAGTACWTGKGRSSREARRESIGWPLKSVSTVKLPKIKVLCRVTLCRLVKIFRFIEYHYVPSKRRKIPQNTSKPTEISSSVTPKGGKDKAVIVYAMKAYGGSRHIASLIPKLGARWRW